MSLRTHVALAAFALLFVSTSRQVDAGPVLLITFDEPQLVDNDPLLYFYSGGFTYRGIGGGPDLGVSFGLNARERKKKGLVGKYTRPGFMQLYSDTAREGEGISTHMDVAGGFTDGMHFSYAAIDAPGRLLIFGGIEGSGQLLANLLLPVTSPLTGPGVFVADSVAFSGVAHSIVFKGGNKQIAFDDLATTSFVVPEPSSLHVLMIGGLCCMGLLLLARRRIALPG
jgi:hypothetical protein